MSYKNTIQEIINFPWESADPQEIIVLSQAIAQEFADSLRRCVVARPTEAVLKDVAAGELKTSNLQFGEYRRVADHWEFLNYFAAKHSIICTRAAVSEALERYLDFMSSLSADETVMMISSREKETKEIYLRILRSHDWDAIGYGFYAYYLQRHIALDSEEGGHADALSVIPIDGTVLERGYRSRLELYQSLFR